MHNAYRLSVRPSHEGIVTAATNPIDLFSVSEEDRKNSVADEIFAWDRTVSRLTEMQSSKYLTESVRNMDSDQFMSQYALKSLTDEEMLEMWRRYDADDSGEIDDDELRHFLCDLLEKEKFHRNLPEEAFAACKEAIDTNKDGKVSWEEFQHFLGDYTLVKSTARL